MTLGQLYTLLKATGYPVAYSHFVVTSTNPMPAPPFICYVEAYTSNFMADDKVHQKVKNMQVELYTTKKDLTVESTLENVLDANDLPYDVIETYIETEKLFQRIYEIGVI